MIEIAEHNRKKELARNLEFGSAFSSIVESEHE